MIKLQKILSYSLLSKIYLRAIWVFLIALTPILFSACGNGVTDVTNIRVVFPDSTKVSYFNHVQPFLNQRCAYAGCHSDFHMAGGRSMASYFQVVNSNNIGLIIPGNAEGSLLYQVVNGSNNHLYRYNLPIANTNQINGIKRWIDDGAADN